MRTKIYFAKSNRANPDQVSKVRSILSKYSNNIELVEFKGGKYSHKDLESCDMLIVLPDLTHFDDLSDDRIGIGRGLYEQIETFAEGNTSTNSCLVVIEASDNWVSIAPIMDVEVEDSDDYIDYGSLLIDTDAVADDLEEMIKRRFVKTQKTSSSTSNLMYLLIGRD